MESIREILKRRPEIGFENPSESHWDDIPEEPNNPGCPICHGLSWVHPLVNGRPDYAHAKRCRCMKARDETNRQLKYRKFCQLPKDAEELSFAQYRTSHGKKVYSTLVEALARSKELAEGVTDLHWLVMMAERDRGKSHLAKCICKRWLERGFSARYTSVPDLLIELRDGFKRDGEHSYNSMYNFFCRVSLLVLDDLGMEHHTGEDDWAMEQLECIVNNRYENNLYLVVTTNKPLDQISPRIASRLQRYPKCRIVVMDESPEYRLWRGK